MSGTGYWFGMDRAYRSGITIGRYANDQITWEIAKKTNLGIELGLFNDLTLLTDYFTETRENILQTRTDIPTTMGGSVQCHRQTWVLQKDMDLKWS